MMTAVMMAVMMAVAACGTTGLPFGCAPPTINSSLLHRAAECGASAAQINALIAAGEDINGGDLFANRPLHRAADKRTMQNLLAAGADPTIRKGSDETMLHHIARAPSGFDAATVGMLGDAGIDVDAKNVDGNSALHVAAQRTAWRPTPIPRALIAAGADVNAQNRHGNTPLHLAVMNTRRKEINLEDAIYALASFGLTVTYRYSQDGLGRGARNMIALLVDHGAKTNIRNDNGMTARDLALTKTENPSVLKALDGAE